MLHTSISILVVSLQAVSFRGDRNISQSIKSIIPGKRKVEEWASSQVSCLGLESIAKALSTLVVR